MYLHSNEIEEIGVISLDGVNVESDPQKEILLGVCCTVAPDTSFLNPLQFSKVSLSLFSRLPTRMP